MSRRDRDRALDIALITLAGPPAEDERPEDVAMFGMICTTAIHRMAWLSGRGPLTIRLGTGGGYVVETVFGIHKDRLLPVAISLAFNDGQSQEQKLLLKSQKRQRDVS